jgi:hypothetical protein
MRIQIICDLEGKNVIESLCHTGMVHTDRANFIPNLAITTIILNGIEVEVPDKQPTEPDKPQPKDPS